jgi:hypothetical protein
MILYLLFIIPLAYTNNNNNNNNTNNNNLS